MLFRSFHNCISALISRINQVRFQKSEMESRFGLNTQYFLPKCKKGHEMKFQYGRPSTYRGGARCDVCREKKLEVKVYFYHCKDCRYDLCIPCSHAERKIVGKSQNSISLHSITEGKGSVQFCGFCEKSAKIKTKLFQTLAQ